MSAADRESLQDFMHVVTKHGLACRLTTNEDQDVVFTDPALLTAKYEDLVFTDPALLLHVVRPDTTRCCSRVCTAPLP